jgi:molecular chaperone GrpE
VSDDQKDTEGWESLVEEASEGKLAPSEELEEAMREAAEAVEARGAPQGHKNRVKELEAELEALRDRHLRLQADLENFRRRALKEREDAHAFGHQNLVKDLLPTVDNLERAIDHARQNQVGDLQGLLQGVELVERELLAALAKHGVTVIAPEGEPFDPAVHEAMAQVEDETREENTVVQVLQRGYSLHDRLIRPARVIVSRRPKQQT